MFLSPLLGAGFKVRLYFAFYLFINLGAGDRLIFKAEVKTELGKRRKTCKSLFSSFSDAGARQQLC